MGEDYDLIKRNPVDVIVRKLDVPLPDGNECVVIEKGEQVQKATPTTEQNKKPAQQRSESEESPPQPQAHGKHMGLKIKPSPFNQRVKPNSTDWD